MLVAVTPLDVALVTAVAAVVGAAVAPAVTWLAAVGRERHDRWAQRYEDRRDAYLGALRVGYRTIDVLTEFIRVLEANDPGSLDIPDPQEQEHYELMARIGLFAPPEIARGLGAFEEARQTALETLMSQDVTSEEGRGVAVTILRPARDSLEKQMEPLRVKLHGEIASR